VIEPSASAAAAESVPMETASSAFASVDAAVSDVFRAVDALPTHAETTAHASVAPLVVEPGFIDAAVAAAMR